MISHQRTILPLYLSVAACAMPGLCEDGLRSREIEYGVRVGLRGELQQTRGFLRADRRRHAPRRRAGRRSDSRGCA